MMSWKEFEGTFGRKLSSLSSFLPTLLLVSCGVDSMVLLDLYFRFFSRQFLKNHSKKSSDGNFFAVLHVDYGLRVEENKREREMIEEYCREKKIVLHLEKAPLAKQKGENIQDLARKKRFSLALAKCRKFGYRSVATGHHGDDAVETFLWKLLQGQSVTSLASFGFKRTFWREKSGEKKKRIYLLRPLIDFNKKEVLCYAKECAIKYCEDSSNLLDDYQRNYLRNAIMPLLQQRFPNAAKNLQLSQRNIRHFFTFSQKCLKKNLFFVSQGRHIVFSEDFFRVFSDEEKKVVVHQYFLQQCSQKRFSYKEITEIIEKITQQRQPKTGKKSFIALMETPQNVFYFGENVVYCCSEKKKISQENDFFWSVSWGKRHLEVAKKNDFLFIYRMSDDFFLQFGGEPKEKKKWFLGFLPKEELISFQLTRKISKDRLFIAGKSFSLLKYLKNQKFSSFFRERGWNLRMKVRGEEGETFWQTISFFSLAQLSLENAHKKMGNMCLGVVCSDLLQKSSDSKGCFRPLWIVQK